MQEKEVIPTSLLPCPFCGSKAELDYPFVIGGQHCGQNPLRIRCSQCGIVQREDYRSQYKALVAWNTRTVSETSRDNENKKMLCGDSLPKESNLWTKITDIIHGYWRTERIPAERFEQFLREIKIEVLKEEQSREALIRQAVELAREDQGREVETPMGTFRERAHSHTPDEIVSKVLGEFEK